MKVSRREFLLASSVFALTAARVFPMERKHILVLGAGLAGLSSAYELAKLGHAVTIIEGRERLGGRIRTLRDAFDSDLFLETGGELFGDGYKRLIGYTEEFGIEVEEMRPETETGGSVSAIQDGIGSSVFMKGRFYAKGDNFETHPYGLKGDEAKMLPGTLLGRHIRLINSEIRAGKTDVMELDKISMGDALRARGASPEAVRLMDISLNYNSIETVSAGAVIEDGNRRRNAGTVPLKIPNGNDTLIAAMAKGCEAKGCKIESGAIVSKIKVSGNAVSVETKTKAGKKKIFKGDRVICSIPFSALRKVRFQPGLSRKKAEAIKSLDYTKNTKVYLQAGYRGWESRSIGSSIWTDTHLERIFSLTAKPGDQHGLFAIWTEGNGSDHIGRMKDQARMNYCVSELLKMLPFMRGSIEKTATYSWSSDPFAYGSYAHFKVGQLSSIRPNISTQEGLIHFAGEHTANEMPGMEGALESAARVVSEITT
ncbi:MAG: FAD-dependent oxidoreductase [Pyrinomonadaceae bacterium]